MGADVAVAPENAAVIRIMYEALRTSDRFDWYACNTVSARESLFVAGVMKRNFGDVFFFFLFIIFFY